MMPKPYLNKSFDLDDDEWIDVLDELPYWSAPFGIRLLENLRIKNNMTALDIGFGNGFPLTEIAMRLGDSSKVYGIDPWLAASKRVNKKIKLYGIKNIELITGSAENLHFKDQYLDLISSNNGINNVNDQDRVLSECSRVLKDEGQFLISMNLNTSLKELYDTMESILNEAEMHEEIEKMHRHIYEKRKPLDEMCSKIEENDFTIKNVVKDSFAYSFADGTTMLNHYFIQLAFLEGWKNIIPVEKQESIFDTIEQRLNKVAKEEGMVKLSIPFVVLDCIRNKRI